jgi:hypothetical protein
MRVGLHALGIGTGARPEVIRAVATAAEAAGFATLRAGEHVVLVDQPRSRYPYSGDGRIAVPASADWLDPLLGLSFDLSVAVALADGSPGMLPELAAIGVTEFVVVAAPPAEPTAAGWVQELAAQWDVIPGLSPRRGARPHHVSLNPALSGVGRPRVQEVS